MSRRWAGLVLVVFLAVGILAGAAVQASPPRRGADALTGYLSARPRGCTYSFGYFGGGSSSGERALIEQRFDPFATAFMTRALRPSADLCAAPSRAEGIRFGLDGISLMTTASDAAACGGGLLHDRTITITVDATQGGHACPGCSDGTYTFTDWRQVLALLYGGKHNDAASTIDCDSAVRRSVADTWGHLFQQGCTGAACSQLQRLWRPSDLTGTSDDFLRLVGLAPMPLYRTIRGATPAVSPYCNARAAGPKYGGEGDLLDLDPIRRPCVGDGQETGDQVCGYDGTLGLLLPLYVPATGRGHVVKQYTVEMCDPGKFRLLSPAAVPALVGLSSCLGGRPLVFGKCFTPIRELANGQFTADCLARRFPTAFGFGPGDGRVHNQVIKWATGHYAADLEGRLITGAFHRIHTTTAPRGSTCREATTTRQLGCLLSAQSCTLGFAARNAWQGQPTIAPLAVNGVLPERQAIQRFDVLGPGPIYPLSRALYANSWFGFERNASFPDGDGAVYNCTSTASLVDPALEANNFIPLPGGPRCEDFDEVAACGAAVNVDACANNPPPAPRLP